MNVKLPPLVPPDTGCAPYGETPLRAEDLGDHPAEVVLHCCCAPCSGAVLEALLHFEIMPHLFFYNPNIHPEAEYCRRRDELIAFASRLNLAVTVGDGDYAWYRRAVSGLEDEPERGRRCARCFYLRLKATAIHTRELGLTHFTTTLATSRWKSKVLVNTAGAQAAAEVPGVTFWDQDWRKKGMYGRRNELVKALDFYNQDYCGCEFSERARERQDALRRARENQTP